MTEPYDIIFAGGGTTACVVASRLAAADPSLKILVLEAGEHTHELPAHIQPARYFTNLVPTSRVFSFHVAKPSDYLGGRSIVIPSGRCLGGGSSVNFMMYTRAASSDYDDWENVYGNSGWGSKDLIPLLEKTETFQVKPGAPTHGYSGPLKVSKGGALLNIGQQFLDAAASYDKERGFTEDVNGLFSCNAYGKWPKWIDAETGKRSDVPHHFIYGKEFKNMKILVGCTVKRVIIKDNRATGVEYINHSHDDTLSCAHASRLVVVSAGAFGSPTILERSGIGAKSLLEKNNVELVVDLPGVGENYQDHNGSFVPFLADENADSLDDIFSGDEVQIEKHAAQWASTGKGIMAHNGIDSGIKIRPNEEDLKVLGSDFQKTWEEYFVPAPDKPICFIGPLAAFLGAHSEVPKRKYFTMVYFTDYPVSRGSVHITSGDDASAAPDFDSGFLREPADLAVLRWAYKKARELARRMAFYRGEFKPGHPEFVERSDASCRDLATSVEIAAADIVYTPEDDGVIDEYHRKFVSTTWHSLGTCAMKPRDQLGVVDERLNVYGVQGLKVADLSIAPGNVGSNTYSTALVIAEKAAIIISQDLGIVGV